MYLKHNYGLINSQIPQILTIKLFELFVQFTTNCLNVKYSYVSQLNKYI